ncbi:acetoacetate decarboxylase family protein [Aeromicrobium sp.]|uniref:acetoacetate decarboxylase family protein n=1 Tax=Aeromicrobium sp. TaxID=1871063 RepID=UPI0019B7FAFB|nr:acetoacetate decarboxylase family protein [Aeromicrobium sp.]MBC7633034.1 acetoacetate decarboxylase family protein [Aeromicrobium sp.]
MSDSSAETHPAGARSPETYPAEPWDLHGHAYVGVWLVPRDRLPAPHSSATRPITVFGRGIVSAAFFVYEEPSPLTYNEIMSTVLVREGWRPRVSITHIWVDSPASRDGGRALWAIPKNLAEFDAVPHFSYAARGIGSLSVGRVRRLPWRLPLAFRIAQDREGSLLVSPVRGRIRPGLAAGRWSFTDDGPLGFLAGRLPLLTLAVRPFRLIFGSR